MTVHRDSLLLVTSRTYPYSPQLSYPQDIASFWKPEVKHCIETLRAQGLPLNRKTLIPLVRSKRSVHRRAHCIIHNRHCRIRKARELWAGWPCVSSSPQGLRLGDDGVDFEHFCALMALALELEDWVLPVGISNTSTST
jgi:hypothetical protein